MNARWISAPAWPASHGTMTAGASLRRLFVSRADDLIVMSITGPGKGTVNCKLSLRDPPVPGTGGWGPEAMFKNGIKDISAKADKGPAPLSSRIQERLPRRALGIRGGRPSHPHRRDDDDNRKCAHHHRRGRGARPDPHRLARRIRENPGGGNLRRARRTHAGFRTTARPTPPSTAGSSTAPGSTSAAARTAIAPTEDLIAKSRIGATNPALLEKLYDASRYNILCSSGALMPNLQGIWTGTWSPFWSGDFTMNGNLQTAMAANLSGNMAECLEPYWRFLETNMPAFRDNAKRLYGARGIHVPSRASTHGFNNHFDGEWPMTFWTAGAAWAAQFMYDYYLYTGDEEVSPRAGPAVHEGGRALLRGLPRSPVPDGKLLFSPAIRRRTDPPTIPPSPASTPPWTSPPRRSC
jgi:hypothetical protein